MLTVTQCETVAYLTARGSIVCPKCALPRDTNDGLTQEIIRYSADEDENGMTCDECNAVISEPHNKYFKVTIQEVEVSPDIDTDTLENELTAWLDSLSYVKGCRKVEVTE